MKHELIVVSLEDAVLKCSCGWQRVSTESITQKEAKKEFERHCYNDFNFEWRKTHSISSPPSFTSWKVNYKNHEHH